MPDISKLKLGDTVYQLKDQVVREILDAQTAGTAIVYDGDAWQKVDGYGYYATGEVVNDTVEPTFMETGVNNTYGAVDETADFFNDIEKDKEYIITWDGVKYHCVAKEYQVSGSEVTLLYVGNISFLTEQVADNTKEPFVYLKEYVGGGYELEDIWATKSTDASHTIVVNRSVNSKIDTKWTDTVPVVVIEEGQIVPGNESIQVNEVTFPFSVNLTKEQAAIFENTNYASMAIDLSSVSAAVMNIFPIMMGSNDPTNRVFYTSITGGFIYAQYTHNTSASPETYVLEVSCVPIVPALSGTGSEFEIASTAAVATAVTSKSEAPVTFNSDTWTDITGYLSEGRIVYCTYAEDNKTIKLPIVAYNRSVGITFGGIYNNYYYGATINAATGWVTPITKVLLESTDNKVTSISSSSTDTQYPSAKAVYDAIEASQQRPVTVNITTELVDDYDRATGYPRVYWHISASDMALLKADATSKVIFNISGLTDGSWFDGLPTYDEGTKVVAEKTNRGDYVEFRHTTNWSNNICFKLYDSAYISEVEYENIIEIYHVGMKTTWSPSFLEEALAGHPIQISLRNDVGTTYASLAFVARNGKENSKISFGDSGELYGEGNTEFYLQNISWEIAADEHIYYNLTFGPCYVNGKYYYIVGKHLDPVISTDPEITSSDIYLNLVEYTDMLPSASVEGSAAVWNGTNWQATDGYGYYKTNSSSAIVSVVNPTPATTSPVTYTQAIIGQTSAFASAITLGNTYTIKWLSAFFNCTAKDYTERTNSKYVGNLSIITNNESDNTREPFLYISDYNESNQDIWFYKYWITFDLREAAISVYNTEIKKIDSKWIEFTPKITAAVSQVISQDPLTIQLTDAQAALIENPDFSGIFADLTALDHGLNWFSKVYSPSADGNIWFTMAGIEGDTHRLQYTRSNKQIIYTSISLVDEISGEGSSSEFASTKAVVSTVESAIESAVSAIKAHTEEDPTTPGDTENLVLCLW